MNRKFIVLGLFFGFANACFGQTPITIDRVTCTRQADYRVGAYIRENPNFVEGPTSQDDFENESDSGTTILGPLFPPSLSHTLQGVNHTAYADAAVGNVINDNGGSPTNGYHSATCVWYAKAVGLADGSGMPVQDTVSRAYSEGAAYTNAKYEWDDDGDPWTVEKLHAKIRFHVTGDPFENDDHPIFDPILLKGKIDDFINITCEYDPDNDEWEVSGWYKYNPITTYTVPGYKNLDEEFGDGTSGAALGTVLDDNIVVTTDVSKSSATTEQGYVAEVASADDDDEGQAEANLGAKVEAWFVIKRHP